MTNKDIATFMLGGKAPAKKKKKKSKYSDAQLAAFAARRARKCRNTSLVQMNGRGNLPTRRGL